MLRISLLASHRRALMENKNAQVCARTRVRKDGVTPLSPLFRTIRQSCPVCLRSSHISHQDTDSNKHSHAGKKENKESGLGSGV